MLNGERFIAQCIGNVAEQGYPSIEHIVMDGASTDGTVPIVEECMANHPHVRLISQKDGGLSDALNKGTEAASGNVIGILNVDDFYEPDVFSRAIELLEETPEPGLVVGNCNVIDGAGTLKYVNRPARLRIEDLLLGWEVNQFPVNPSAYFYHRSLHELIGGYDVNEHYALDVDFLLRAVQVANAGYVDELWGNFRFMEGTKTFEDQARGDNVTRMRSILERYLSALPLDKRIRISIIKSYWCLRIYYWRTVKRLETGS